VKLLLLALGWLLLALTLALLLVALPAASTQACDCVCERQRR
jgi:uncharacterized membrane protein YccF (DUF307 family)